MKIFDILAGRTRPAQANLDALFALSNAFITLEAAESLVPSGEAGVCYKPTAGQSFARTAEEMESLLGLGGGPVKVREQTDQYGFHWVVIGSGPTTGDPQALVNQIHVVNSTLEEDGFGPQLLCSVFGFRPAAAGESSTATTYFVYLYKRGTFYPFVPLSGREQRDVATELRLGDVAAEDLKIEKDKERWMALWNLPIH
jgi:hypothetical protein